MDTKTRFKPASFLELDDLFGGRKIVMVGADQITFWDAIDLDKVTPIIIHPIFKPKEVGSPIDFARRNDLMDGLRALTSYIDAAQEGRAQRDPLYVMRSLVAYSRGAADGSENAIKRAIFQASEEEERAIKAQSIYEAYVERAGQDASTH